MFARLRTAGRCMSCRWPAPKLAPGKVRFSSDGPDPTAGVTPEQTRALLRHLDALSKVRDAAFDCLDPCSQLLLLATRCVQASVCVGGNTPDHLHSSLTEEREAERGHRRRGPRRHLRGPLPASPHAPPPPRGPPRGFGPAPVPRVAPPRAPRHGQDPRGSEARGAPDAPEAQARVRPRGVQPPPGLERAEGPGALQGGSTRRWDSRASVLASKRLRRSGM
jgi:hypothetical protein